MGALASFTKWNPEDDLLLKNAVEAGASLESLARGAVHFSCRFTVRELEERWSSLLYDLNTSTEASARIVEIEIGVSVYNPSKHSRACKVKETLSGRRKRESLQCHYYASRKKARNEPHKFSNLRFLMPPSSDAIIGNESGSHDQFKLQNEFALDKFPGGILFSNNYGHPETIYGGSQHAYSKMGEIESTAATSSHVFHGGMVGSIESGVPNGISSRDVLYGHPENISSVTIDEAGYRGVGENFESNLTQKDFPHALDRNHCSSQTSDVPESRPLQSLALNDPNGNVDLEVKPSTDFGSINNKQENYSDFGGNHNPVSKFAGSSSSFHQLGYSSPPPGLPIWKTIEDVSTPTLQMDGQFGEKGQVVLTMEGIKKIDDQACDDVTLKSKINDGISSAALNNSTILSEDNFIDFSSSCMSFTDDEELLFIDVDDDDIGDRSCLNGLSSIFLSSPSDNHMDNLPIPGEPKPPSEAFNTSIPACNVESSMEHETIHDEINTGSSNLDSSVVPGVCILSASSVASPTAEPVEKLMICVLNTEDPDVPCNDDVSFPAKLSQAFAATCLRQDAATTRANDGKATSGSLALVKEGKVASFQPNASNFKAGQRLPKVGFLHSTADFVQEDELSDRDVTSGASRNFKKDMDDPYSIPPMVTSHSAPDLALKQEASTELNMQAALPKCMPSHLELVSSELGCADLLASVSFSDQEEQFVDGDDDVPNFSDVEAMILDMDLGPYDQESCPFSKEVSRYQCLDTKKTIIRLEQGTRSYMNRAISSHGAFAVFYGRHLKYFIRTSEVLLGRETEDIKVDIDLGKEGRANKISRRQAIIKMDGDGSFHLKNIGKSLIFVNSKEVPVKKRINLCSRALIEIKDMRFIFEVYDLAVRRHIASSRQKNQGPKSEYDFVCTSEHLG